MTVYVRKMVESMLNSYICGMHAACKNTILLISIDDIAH